MKEKATKGMMGIYELRNTATNDRYIGSSTSLHHRFRQLLASLALGRHSNRKLQESWNINGPTAFIFNILEISNDYHELSRRELHWLHLHHADEIDGRTEAELNFSPAPGTYISLNREVKDALRDLGIGNLRDTVRILIESHLEHSKL